MKTDRIIEFFDMLAEIAVLSIIWSVCCVPIITVGAATAAGYNTAIEVIRKKQQHVIRKFWNDIKKDFLQTLPFSIALIVCVLAIYLIIDLPEINGYESIFPFALFSQIIIISFLLLFFTYVFSLTGRFQLASIQVLSVALKLCFCKLHKNIIIILSVGSVLAIGVVYPPTVLLLPGLLFYSLTYLLEPQFHITINYDNDI